MRLSAAGPSRPPTRPRGRLSLLPNPILLLAGLLVSTLHVLGHVYNETLDPWNINKNQRESPRCPMSETETRLLMSSFALAGCRDNEYPSVFHK